jgi:hypothetical protein
MKTNTKDMQREVFFTPADNEFRHIFFVPSRGEWRLTIPGESTTFHDSIAAAKRARDFTPSKPERAALTPDIYYERRHNEQA